MKQDQLAAPDCVRTIAHTAAIFGVTEKTLRNMIGRGEGPTVTRLSRGRIGIRDSHRIAWLEKQAIRAPEARASTAA